MLEFDDPHSGTVFLGSSGFVDEGFEGVSPDEFRKIRRYGTIKSIELENS